MHITDDNETFEFNLLQLNYFEINNFLTKVIKTLYGY